MESGVVAYASKYSLSERHDDVRVVEGSVKGSPEETRGRILAAAREIFARKGTRGTTTREVAERALVNEATLFRHFGTKQALLDAMLEQYCGSDTLRSFVGRLDGPLDEQLRALARFAIERLREREDLIRVNLAEQRPDSDATVVTWRGPTGALAELTGFMRRLVESGRLKGDPPMLARAFMSFGFAYVFARKVWDDGRGDTPEAREHAVRTCVDLFLNGARA